MKLTTERLKQIIREELENATDPKTKKPEIKFHKGKDGKFKAGRKRKDEAELDEEVDEANLRLGDPDKRTDPKIKFHRRDDGTMVPGGKAGKVSNPNFKGIKFKKKPPETELDRIKKTPEEDLYRMYVQQGLEERIFRMLVDKINGASK